MDRRHIAKMPREGYLLLRCYALVPKKHHEMVEHSGQDFSCHHLIHILAQVNTGNLRAYDGTNGAHLNALISVHICHYSHFDRGLYT